MKGKKDFDYSKEWLLEKEKQISFEMILNKIRRNKILDFIKYYNFQKILEIGCGLEPLFIYLKSFEKYIVVEPNKIFYQIALNLLKDCKNCQNVIIINDYFENVAKKLKDFDLIILSSVLHEVPNPDLILQSIYDICNNDTIVHINVPNVYSLHNLLGFEMGIIKDLFEETKTGIRFNRKTRFDQEKLLQIVENNEFSVIEMGSYFIKPFTNEQMESMLEKNIINLKVIEGLEKIIKYFPKYGAEIYVNIKKKT